MWQSFDSFPGNPIPEDQNITLTTSNITAFTALIQWEGTSNGQLIFQYRSQGIYNNYCMKNISFYV